MQRKFVLALAVVSLVGGAFATSGASAAAMPGPNAVPNAALVQTVDPDVTAVEQVRRRGWRGRHRGWRHRGYHRRHGWHHRRHWRRHHHHRRWRGPRWGYGWGWGRPYYGYRRCYWRNRRVWTPWGWRRRPVRVCRRWY